MNLLKMLALGWLTACATFGLDNMHEYWMTSGNFFTRMSYSQYGSQPAPSGRGDWTGTIWSRNMNIQSGTCNPMINYDIFELVNGTLYCYGCFKGNYMSAPRSNFWLQPIVWMRPSMNVGDEIVTANQYYDLTPINREQLSNPLVRSRKTKLANWFPTYTVPETGVTYYDVIDFCYYPDVNNSSNVEEYWCARGRGWIRATVAVEGLTKWAVPDSSHPNGASWGYGADGFDTRILVQKPLNAWFSQVGNPYGINQNFSTYLWNGAFEKPSKNDLIPGWFTSATPTDTGVKQDAYLQYGAAIPASSFPSGNDEAGPTQMWLTGTYAGDYVETYAYSVGWTPVTPGVTYQLSGWIRRYSPNDTAYIDLHGGQAADQNQNPITMPNLRLNSTRTDGWEYVSGTFMCPWNVYFVRAQCYRLGPQSTAVGFDDVRLAPAL